MTSAHFVYIVQCADGTLYTGYTTDVTRRIAEHNAGAGRSAKYTRARRPVTLVYYEPCVSKAAAQPYQKSYEIHSCWSRYIGGGCGVVVECGA